MRLICISDTHSRHADMSIPDGDVLIHAGDFTKHGGPHEIRAFNQWLGLLPHRHKLVIAGNHDFLFEDSPEEARALISHATYLEDASFEIEGVHFWGSPWQPRFFDWAFNLDRGEPLRAKWQLIPENTDVLVTHGPPHAILDRTSRGERVGCEELAIAVSRLKPRVHVFGHIHESYGELVRDGTRFVNACSCDLSYRATQAPITLEI